jgi:phosphohistidine phosphatase
MMNVYLVQHAQRKSKEEDPELSLSETGIRNIRKVAAFASSGHLLRPNVIFHSGKRRAMQTAEILAEYINPEKGISVSDGLQSGDPPSIWISRIAAASDDIMLVGHLPHLSRLASGLLCGDQDREIIKFTYAGIVCIRQTETGGWAAAWILTPEIIG